MTRVLLIEDDPETATEILTELGGNGYAVAHAVTGTAGLLRARGEAWDLLIVDRMLPGQDGLSVVRQLRQENVQTPALFLSALGGIDDKVLGLRAVSDGLRRLDMDDGAATKRLQPVVARFGLDPVDLASR